ncbi:MAG: dolichyl-phosphate beta-D-mannosyltransferase [Flavobacterium sp. BFFFF2]|nr:MAG: dolichyl-phosphate beta-D-mannosyltransferase [Flavobacterium sp. BFFFF2]
MNQGIVIIPTYQEAENIEAIIHSVMELAVAFDVLIVDDSSPDGTAQMVRQLQNSFPNRLFLEERAQKSGLGTAYVHGFRWALGKGYDFIFEMDADFSHNPKDLIPLFEACQSGADLAIGSRYVTGVNVVNWPLSRVLLSYFASVYVRKITGMQIMDTTAGFVCFRRQVLEQIDLDAIHFIGYAFQIEMKYRTYCLHKKMVEVPIIFTDRTKGESKMSKSIIREAIFGVLTLRFNHLINRF